MTLFDKVQSSLKTAFNPSENATARQIRFSGFGAWVIGFLIMVVLCWAISVLERIISNTNLGIVYISITVVAFGLMTTGCYRTLTGKKTSKITNDYEVSYTRVIKGVVSFILSTMIPTSIMLLFLYFLQWMGIEPNTLF
jgi:hypothetical protein